MGNLIVDCHGKNAALASQETGVKASDILAILTVEGGTAKGCKPVRPRDGAGNPSFGQFTFGTAQSMGVTVGDSKSEVSGIARYLIQLGYKENKTKAIAAYNGGPGNPQYDYAAKVAIAAVPYKRLDGVRVLGTEEADETVTSKAGDEVVNKLDSVGNFLDVLGKKSTWTRTGLVVLGGILTTAAVAILAGEFMSKANPIVKAIK